MPAPQATLSPCQRASFRSRSDKGASSKVAVSSPRCTPHGYSHERRTSSPPCALSHAACMRPVAPAPPAVVVPAPVVSPTMDIWGDAPGTTELSWISTAPSASFVMNSARLESLNVGSCASVCARARDASRANAASSSSLYAMSVRCPQALQGRPQPHLPSRRHRCTFTCRRVGLSHTQSRRQHNKDARLTLCHEATTSDSRPCVHAPFGLNQQAAPPPIQRWRRLSVLGLQQPLAQMRRRQLSAVAVPCVPWGDAPSSSTTPCAALCHHAWGHPCAASYHHAWGRPCAASSRHAWAHPYGASYHHAAVLARLAHPVRTLPAVEAPQTALATRPPWRREGHRHRHRRPVDVASLASHPATLQPCLRHRHRHRHRRRAWPWRELAGRGLRERVHARGRRSRQGGHPRRPYRTSHHRRQARRCLQLRHLRHIWPPHVSEPTWAGASRTTGFTSTTPWRTWHGVREARDHGRQGIRCCSYTCRRASLASHEALERVHDITAMDRSAKQPQHDTGDAKAPRRCNGSA